VPVDEATTEQLVALTDELDELAGQLQTLVEELGLAEGAGMVRGNLTRDVAVRAERVLRIAYYCAGLSTGAVATRARPRSTRT
jgi:hypothetical protein